MRMYTYVKNKRKTLKTYIIITNNNVLDSAMHKCNYICLKNVHALKWSRFYFQGKRIWRNMGECTLGPYMIYYLYKGKDMVSEVVELLAWSRPEHALCVYKYPSARVLLWNRCARRVWRWTQRCCQRCFGGQGMRRTWWASEWWWRAGGEHPEVWEPVKRWLFVPPIYYCAEQFLSLLLIIIICCSPSR